MSSLLLSTLAMMGLTFVIGFFVAGIIKSIANWADFINFYRTHREELHHAKQTAEVQVSAIASKNTTRKHTAYDHKEGKLIHILNETINPLKPRKQVTA